MTDAAQKRFALFEPGTEPYDRDRSIAPYRIDGADFDLSSLVDELSGTRSQDSRHLRVGDPKSACLSRNHGSEPAVPAGAGVDCDFHLSRHDLPGRRAPP